MKKLSLCDVNILAVQERVQQIFDKVLADSEFDTCDTEDKVRAIFLHTADSMLEVFVDWVEE